MTRKSGDLPRCSPCPGAWGVGAAERPLVVSSPSAGANPPLWLTSQLRPRKGRPEGSCPCFRTVLLASVALTTSLSQAVAAQDAFALDEIIVTGGLSPIAAGCAAARVQRRDSRRHRGAWHRHGAGRAARACPASLSPGPARPTRRSASAVAEASHTLILIDGIAAAGGDGEYILSGLDTANIAKIEVLRGPQSVYYGSDASAGRDQYHHAQGSGRNHTQRFARGVVQSTTATAFLVAPDGSRRAVAGAVAGAGRRLRPVRRRRRT